MQPLRAHVVQHPRQPVGRDLAGLLFLVEVETPLPDKDTPELDRAAAEDSKLPAVGHIEEREKVRHEPIGVPESERDVPRFKVQEVAVHGAVDAADVLDAGPIGDGDEVGLAQRRAGRHLQDLDGEVGRRRRHQILFLRRTRSASVISRSSHERKAVRLPMTPFAVTFMVVPRLITVF